MRRTNAHTHLIPGSSIGDKVGQQGDDDDDEDDKEDEDKEEDDDEKQCSAER